MNDDGLAELGRKLQLALEERALTVVRRVVPVEVEPGLADRDHALVAEQLAELVETPRVFVGGLVRVDPEGGEDPLLPARRWRGSRGRRRARSRPRRSAPPRPSAHGPRGLLPARRTRRGARGCRSSRCGRQVDAREERRGGLDPLGLGRQPGRDPFELELDRLPQRTEDQGRRLRQVGERARPPPSAPRPRGHRAPGRARPPAPRPSRAATAPLPRRGG